jgi:hypothetical protein
MEGHSGNLGNDDPSQGIGNGRIHPFNFHFHGIAIPISDIDSKICLEVCEVEDLIDYFLLYDLLLLETDDFLGAHLIVNNGFQIIIIN